jgi:hypothetical protein
VLLRLLTTRFGALDGSVVERIQSARDEQLDVWIDRVLVAGSIDGVVRLSGFVRRTRLGSGRGLRFHLPDRSAKRSVEGGDDLTNRRGLGADAVPQHVKRAVGREDLLHTNARRLLGQPEVCLVWLFGETIRERLRPAAFWPRSAPESDDTDECVRMTLIDLEIPAPPTPSSRLTR